MPETDPTRHPYLYRAIKKKRWYDKANRQVLPAAFELRESDQGKLSVLKFVDCSPGTQEQCYARLNECYGEFVVSTNDVRTLGLEVHDDEPDAVNYSENHASIIGIPPPPQTDDALIQANDFYARLAEFSQLHYDRDSRYA